jgi:hypothetical protein
VSPMCEAFEPVLSYVYPSPSGQITRKTGTLNDDRPAPVVSPIPAPVDW